MLELICRPLENLLVLSFPFFEKGYFISSCNQKGFNVVIS